MDKADGAENGKTRAEEEEDARGERGRGGGGVEG